MMTSGEEVLPDQRRRHPRRLYLKAVAIRLGDRTSRGMIQNLSAGGLYVESREPPPVGQRITLSYMASDNATEIMVEGDVVRADEDGFGIEYA
jgi:hypothetical protein